jgi:hypothetical protein
MGLFTERDEETPNEIIIGKLNRIEAKLDEVIAAMHAYDDENIEDVNEGYGESSFESFMDSKDDILNWKVDGAERRIDIIGQNGNTGEHYENEIINKPANTNVNKKKRDKWISPYPPNPKRNVNKEPISQKQYNLNRDKMANDHYELGGEG